MSRAPTPHIRPATDADGPALAALVAGIFADYDGVAFDIGDFPELAAVASYFGEHGGRLWVVEDGGVVAGSFGVVMTHEPGVAEFLKVYLARSLRGTGLARQLYDLALGFARGAGAHAVSLWSDAKFAEGHRFYRRQGFVRMPGVRAIHDASATLEYNFRLEPLPAP